MGKDCNERMPSRAEIERLRKEIIEPNLAEPAHYIGDDYHFSLKSKRDGCVYHYVMDKNGFIDRNYRWHLKQREERYLRDNDAHRSHILMLAGRLNEKKELLKDRDKLAKEKANLCSENLYLKQRVEELEGRYEEIKRDKDSADYMYNTYREYDKCFETKQWSEKIPSFKLPPDWELRIVPPFAGAVVRFGIKTPGGLEFSVYLDCYNILGYYYKEEPYWEMLLLNKYDENNNSMDWRFDLDDVDQMIRLMRQLEENYKRRGE